MPSKPGLQALPFNGGSALGKPQKEAPFGQWWATQARHGAGSVLDRFEIHTHILRASLTRSSLR